MARLRALALTAAVTLVAMACTQAPPSGESNSARGGGSASQAVPGGSVAPDGNVVPELAVLDVATGDSVDLGGLIPAERPILLWFWAPH